MWAREHHTDRAGHAVGTARSVCARRARALKQAKPVLLPNWHVALAVVTVPFLSSILLTKPACATTFDLQTATMADIQAATDASALTSEKLVQLYLDRIAAYDKKGPKINAIITLNPKALEEARALDAERRAKGPRSQLHGVAGGN